MQLSLPLPSAATEIARRFAAQQHAPEKAARVRLNTLAVWVVNEYLGLMGIPTDLSAGDSWNAVVRLCADVADLEVSGCGRLECRPMRAGDRFCHIPYEVWHDRIGYVVVQIDEAEREAVVAGFLPAVTVPSVALSDLQPVERLLNHLDDWRQRQPFVQLQQWLQAQFAPEWQALESVLQPQHLGYAFRSATTAVMAAPTAMGDVGVCRAKAIDVSRRECFRSVALVLEVRPDEDSRWHVRIQVVPLSPGPCLPLGLELEVRDDTDAVFLEARSRSMDDCLQMQFCGAIGECFSVRVAVGDRSTTDRFQL